MRIVLFLFWGRKTECINFYKGLIIGYDMGSGIILIKQYMTESAFGHYFEPAFGCKGIDITDRHFFRKLASDEKALLALKGNVTKGLVYDVMAETVSAIEKENEESDFGRIPKSQVPEWCHLFPSLIDERPEIIGIYNDSKTASEFFGTVGLEYVAEEMKKEVSRTIESVSSEFRALGQKFSEF